MVNFGKRFNGCSLFVENFCSSQIMGSFGAATLVNLQHPSTKIVSIVLPAFGEPQDSRSTPSPRLQSSSTHMCHQSNMSYTMFMRYHKRRFIGNVICNGLVYTFQEFSLLIKFGLKYRQRICSLIPFYYKAIMHARKHGMHRIHTIYNQIADWIGGLVVAFSSLYATLNSTKFEKFCNIIKDFASYLRNDQSYLIIPSCYAYAALSIKESCNIVPIHNYILSEILEDVNGGL